MAHYQELEDTMSKFALAEETLGYVTSQEQSNTDFRYLVDGSKNVVIDFQKKVAIRAGYKRLGAANTSLTPCYNAWTWDTSTGFKAYMRFYDDELEIYLTTVDGTALNAWYRVRNGWTTTEKLRHAFWFDTTENIDLCIMVNGNANTYAWNGAVAVVSSVTANTITKAGTTTFAQNRFFTSSNRTLINVRTGTEFTYTGGEGTTTLTGVSGSPVSDGMVAGDVLVQKVITNSNSPAASRNNHTIFGFENQIAVGSEDDEEVYLSKNTDYTDFTFSSPRLSGEGALFTLTDYTRGFSSIGSHLIIFSGKNTIFRTNFQQQDVGGTLTETVDVKKIDAGIDQGALCQEAIINIGDAIAYLTNEVTLRMISDPDELSGINPKTISTPIKPDFDDEDWYDSNSVPQAHMMWYKNSIYITAPESSRMYILSFVEDANGKLFRFWNAPQILPVGPMSVIDSGTGNDLSNGERLHGHSNAVPETYLLFEGNSDGLYASMAVGDKLPIDAKAIFAYNNYGDRIDLKNFDEYYVYGEITPSTTELTLGLNYDFDGITQAIEETIDGSDEDILEGELGVNSLAQTSLAVHPLGGLTNPPSDSRKFRLSFEIAKEDFFEIQPMFMTNDVDKYWAIIAHGANATKSKRKSINIKK